MANFKLSIFHLLDQHPLYRYRTPEGRLHVLLIGYGSRLDQLLDVILSNGQLLDTDLRITVATPNPDGALAALQKRAPDLHRFVRMQLNGKAICTPQQQFASVSYTETPMTDDGIRTLFASPVESPYILISTGHDDKNYSLALACSKLSFSGPALIAHVQKKEAAPIPCASSQISLLPLREDLPDAFQDQIETLALNLSYLYEKSQYDRVDSEDVKTSFYHDEYTYLSNLEAALHLRSKLYCCAIPDQDYAAAAEAFSHLRVENPRLIDRLCALEHRRWMLSKITAGYVQLRNLDQIYTCGNSTHSSSEKWHTCLVPYEAGQSCLKPEDWDSESIRRELDPLDRISVQIHQKCLKLYEGRRFYLFDQIHTLQRGLLSGSEYSVRTQDLSGDLERAVLFMSEQKANSYHVYLEVVTELTNRIRQESTRENCFLADLLQQIQIGLQPLVEYIRYKDYKEQDRILVSNIPFALTFRFQPVLLKLLSDQNARDLFSLWQMDCRQIVFCGTVFHMMELKSALTRLYEMHRFLRNSCPAMDHSCFLLVSGELYDQACRVLKPGLLSQVKTELIPVETWDPAGLKQALCTVLSYLKEVSYIDCTGGNPLLCHAAILLAQERRIGTFYVHEDQMYNLEGAPELAYSRPGKAITVKEMLELSGAVITTRASEKCSDFAGVYQKLFKISMEHAADWKDFVSRLAQFFSHQTSDCSVFNFNLAQTHKANEVTHTPWRSHQIFISQASDADRIYRIFQDLQDCQYIRRTCLKPAIGGGQDLLYELNPLYETEEEALLSSRRVTLERVIHAYLHSNASHRVLSHSKGSGIVSWSELLIRDFPVTSTGSQADAAIMQILRKLEHTGLIRLLRTGSRPDTVSFDFASEDAFQCLTTVGAALEYELYYTAMLEGHFTDVEMGCEFSHSAAADAPVNEIDVIANRGISSLFISAKFRTWSTMFISEYRYILYEILLEAEKFGIHGKAVLATPLISMFESPCGYAFSAPMKQAAGRGVYFLGRECFSSEKVLAATLDRIMDGRDDWYKI